MPKQLETQVLIIGAGSTGIAIARELSKYKVDTTVVDKDADFCSGVVKHSHGSFYSGVGLTAAHSLILKSIATPDIPASKLFHQEGLKTKLAIDGFKEFPTIAKQLDIPFKQTTRLVLGKDESDFKSLKTLEEICRSMEIEPEPLDREAINALEPHVNKEITRGFARHDDLFCAYSWEYGIALAENARDNGVRFMLLNEVQSITTLNGGFVVNTTCGTIKTRFIVNAAGIYADRIAEMAGVRDFGLTYWASQELVTDRRLGGLLNNNASLVPRPGVPRHMRPTLSGNITVSCSGFKPITEPDNVSSKREWIDENIARGRELLPTLSKADVITSVGGSHATNTRDPENHLLEVSKGNPNFINAVIRMPGLGLTPAMAKYIVGMLGNQGLELTEKADFKPNRKRIPKVNSLSEEERRNLIKLDPRYGHIVCRCEEVSEGEIVEAIRRGARTVAGVKYRTRAGMGRCQGGFCGPRVVEILARELDIPLTEVTQKGGMSRVLLYRSKELLGSGV